MYVNPFVAGIVATILIELAIIVIVAVFAAFKGKK